MTLDYWKKEIVDEIIDTIKNKPVFEDIVEKPKIEEETNEQVVETIKNESGIKTASETINIESKHENTETKCINNFESIDIKSTSELKSLNSAIMKDPILSEINIHNIIRKFDEHKPETPAKPRVLPRTQIKKSPEVPPKPEGKVKPAVPPRSATTKLRGKLDKSHSTPAYDLSEEPEQTPIIPEISKEFEKIEITKCIIKEVKEVREIEEIRETKEVIREFVREVNVPLNESIYQLGIPVVEAVNLPVVFKDEIIKAEELATEVSIIIVFLDFIKNIEKAFTC